MSAQPSIQEQPRYEHDCPQCTYLGQHDNQDLYVCAGPDLPPTLIARHDSDGPEYVSGSATTMYTNDAIREAFTRARDRGIVTETSRDRVLLSLMTDDPHANVQTGFDVEHGKIFEVFHADNWVAAEELIARDGGAFLREIAQASMVDVMAVAAALQDGVTSLDDLPEVLRDPQAYYDRGRPEYGHEPACPAHGDPQWATVDSCGPCDVLRADKERTPVRTTTRRNNTMEPPSHTVG